MEIKSTALSRATALFTELKALCDRNRKLKSKFIHRVCKKHCSSTAYWGKVVNAGHITKKNNGIFDFNFDPQSEAGQKILQEIIAAHSTLCATYASAAKKESKAGNPNLKKGQPNPYLVNGNGEARAVKLLKGLGYKILKPAVSFEEV